MKPCLLMFAALLASDCTSAFAESYTLLIFETPATLSQRNIASKADAYWSSYDGYAGALAQAGVLRGGTALSAADTSGHLSKSKIAAAAPQVSGYFVIDVPSLVDARSWAAKAPALVSRVDVMPHHANPHMSKAPTPTN